MPDVGERITALYDNLVGQGVLPSGWDGVPDHDPDPRGSIFASVRAGEEWLALESTLYGVLPTALPSADLVREAAAIAELLADGEWEDDVDGTSSADEWVSMCLKATPYGE